MVRFNFLTLSLLAATTAFAVKTPVYLIRHGEKPDDGGSELSPRTIDIAQSNQLK